MSASNAFTAATKRHRSGLLHGKGSGKLILGFSIVAIFVLLAIVSLLWTPYDPTGQNMSSALLAPGNAGHILGTDELGRDVFSRVMAAAAIDLPVTVICTLLPCILGTVLGLISGYYGGFPDTVIMRFGDLLQAFPQYVLMIVLVFVLGAGVPSILVSFTIVGWVIYARLARTEVMRIKESQFVMSAMTSGFSSLRIIARHIFPNVVKQIVIYLTSDLVFTVVALAAFSFLGFGIQQPTAEWGSMIASGQRYLSLNPWLVIVPGICLSVFAFGLALIGDALQDRMAHS
jgi:peptide/nickel transport system permease protein